MCLLSFLLDMTNICICAEENVEREVSFPQWHYLEKINNNRGKESLYKTIWFSHVPAPSVIPQQKYDENTLL